MLRLPAVIGRSAASARAVRTLRLIAHEAPRLLRTPSLMLRRDLATATATSAKPVARPRGRSKKTEASAEGLAQSMAPELTVDHVSQRDKKTVRGLNVPRTITSTKVTGLGGKSDTQGKDLEGVFAESLAQGKTKRTSKKKEGSKAVNKEGGSEAGKAKSRVAVEAGDGEKEVTKADLSPSEKALSDLLGQALEKAKRAPQQTAVELTKEQIAASECFQKLGIQPRLTDALASLNLKEPFPIQHIGVPELKKGGDIILSAETGTGKTFTYLLPILSQFMEEESQPGWEMNVKEKHTRAIILVPNRDLGSQVNAAAISLARAAKHRLITAEVLPGQKVEKQAKNLQRAPDITIATPARLVQHRTEKAVMYNDVEWVIVDEVDTLLQEGYVEHLDRILQPLLGIRQTRKGSKPLNFVFVSATVGKDVQRAIQKFFPTARTVYTQTVGTVSSKVKQEFVPTSRDDEKLGKLIEHMKTETREMRSLIFCNTVGRCTRVRDALVDAGFPSEAFHGGLKPKTRFRNLGLMRKGELRALVATEIASRGLDTLNVSSVINYDCPLDSQEYLRKAGRTGRAGKGGSVTTFYLPSEQPLTEALDAAIKNGAVLATVRQKIAKQVAPPPPSKRSQVAVAKPLMPGKKGGKGKLWDKSKGPNRRGARPVRKGRSSPPKDRIEDGRDDFLEERDSDKAFAARGADETKRVSRDESDYEGGGQDERSRRDAGPDRNRSPARERRNGGDGDRFNRNRSGDRSASRSNNRFREQGSGVGDRRRGDKHDDRGEGRKREWRGGRASERRNRGDGAGDRHYDKV